MNEPVTISKICLGTVQLGLNYGIANRSGQPSKDYSHKLLQYALDHGITALDTARIYGDAEDVIGSFKNNQEFTVISKFKLTDAAVGNLLLATAEARESIKTSCRLLNRKNLPVALFHKDMSQPIEQVTEILPKIFETLIQEGWIKKGGISVYNATELFHVSDWSNMNYTQVPINILDTRLLQKNLLERMNKNKVTIFARSIYLQGLLAMEEPIPKHLSFAIPYREQLKQIAAKAKRSIKNIAFSFVRDTSCITSIVIGAETIEQLGENIELLKCPPLPKDIYAEIKESFNNVPEEIITPALWKNK
jgi:aryl-alcohol dehydrogenase-like predicted oxidoreductase